MSCSYQDEIDAVNDRVDALENSIARLQMAYDNGKIISDVQSIDETAVESRGYLISFSDGTTLSLYHGKDGVNGNDGTNGSDGESGTDGQHGVTPLIKVDTDGYWIVSYDDGLTFENVRTSDGTLVSALGEKGDQGADASGTDGKDGRCVRVVVSEEGYYVFEVYNPASPDEVADRIVTPYNSDKRSVISSIVKNEYSGVITLTMADGSSFDFNLDVAYPTGIVVLNESLIINWNKSGELVFRLNPSDAFINFELSEDDANIFIDVVSAYSGRDIDDSSYVNSATGYKITEVKKYVTPEGKNMRGQYKATIVSNNNGENGLERVCLVIKTKNSKGEDINISSLPFRVHNGEGNEIESIGIGDVDAEKDGNVFMLKLAATTNLKTLKPTITSNCTSIRIKGRDVAYSSDDEVDFSKPVTFVAVGPDGTEQEYTAVVYFSNLPVVYVSTPSAITSKEVWTADCEMQIWNAGENNVTLEKVNIKGRGNSTWMWPKKPYAIKLDKKAAVLGMPKHKRWCLLANYKDRTIMRNDMVNEMAHRMSGLDWTPHGEYVDVVLNGNFVGNYYLCEQIKIDENRINIAEMTAEDLDDVAITGGYLFELDTNYDEINKFRTSKRNLPVMFKEPDEKTLQPSQMEYVKNYFNDVEAKLYADGSYDFEEIGKLIDYDSFIDYWIIYELALNTELMNPKSCYMYKDRNGKLFAGPIWDFDWCLSSTYTYNYKQGLLLTNRVWYSGLFKNNQFVDAVKKRWREAKSELSTIPDYIENKYLKVRESAEINCTIWPINVSLFYPFTNGEETMKYRESVDELKRKYQVRFSIMDEAITNM